MLMDYSSTLRSGILPVADNAVIDVGSWVVN